MATTATRISLGPFFSGGSLVTAPNIYCYEPGTTTDKTVWEDRAKSTAESQPVAGDANGIASFFGDGLYKIVVKDSADTTLYTWDNYQIGPEEDFIPLAGGELTIASGVVTVTTSEHTIDTEADASSDDLDTINGGATNQILVLTAENDARTVVAKHGTGNILLHGGQDFSLDSDDDTLFLFYDGTNWLQLAQSSNETVLKVTPDQLNLQSGGELTIATGAVTATHSRHTIDTESDAASDDLDTISGGVSGQILVVTAADGARTVVLKDGTGNLQLSGDLSLDNAQDTAVLFYDGSNWLELAFSNNGA